MRSYTNTRKKHKTSKQKTSPRSKTSTFLNLLLGAIVIFVLSITIYKLTCTIISASKHNSITKLELTLADVTIEEIDTGDKATKYPGNTLIFTQDEKSTTFRDVEIKGRGNFTWTQAKKPYQIKFSDKVDLLGSGPARKWLLLANYLDPTFLRNDIAFHLADMLDSGHTPHGEYVELYIDGNYRGLYYLTEKIEIGKTRIPLKDEYGILVELDNIYGEDCSYDLEGNCITTKDLVNKDHAIPAKNNFISTLNTLEEAISLQDFATISQLIDVDSFAKYYLLNEFLANPDAYSTSFFMYQDGLSNKIYAGPGWDFDVSLGNSRWNADGVDYELFHSPFETTALRNYVNNNTSSETPYALSISHIIYHLIDIPEFKTRIKDIFQAKMSGKTDELLQYINDTANRISTAAQSDLKRWKNNDTTDEVAYLLDWVAKRFDHFEATYGTIPVEAASRTTLDF